MSGGQDVENNLYYANVNPCFASPREFKSFSDARTDMLTTCSQASNMIDDFNSRYKGNPITQESLIYQGQVEQKIQDCSTLITKVNTLLGID
jgi:hypothetical protein